MKSAVSTGARCEPRPKGLLFLVICASLLIFSACGNDQENPFVRPYFHPQDMGSDAGVSDDFGVVTPVDPYAGTRPKCQGEGVACALDGAAGICVEGRCRLVVCLEGRGDCDGDPSNGCERDLSLAESCGACLTSCREQERCQISAEGYACSAAVLCPEGFYDLDQQEGCEWERREEVYEPLQPAGRLALIERIMFDATQRHGVVVGFDADGARVLLSNQQSLESAPIRFDATPEAPFSGHVRHLALSDTGLERSLALDVWTDAFYLHEITAQDEGQATTWKGSFACQEEALPRELRTGIWNDARGDALRAVLASATHLFSAAPCEREAGATEDRLCIDPASMFGAADYLKAFYPIENPLDSLPGGALAPEAFRFTEAELATCTQCVFDGTSGEQLAPNACLGEAECALADEAAPLCEGVCEQPATGCPDFAVQDVAYSALTQRYYVATARGVVVLTAAEEGGGWQVLGRLESAFDPSVISGARYLRVAVVASQGAGERLFLLDSRGRLRVLDVSASGPLTFSPGYPDVYMDLGDLDARGPMGFVARDEDTLLFADPFRTQLISLSSPESRRLTFDLEEDTTGGQVLGAQLSEPSSFEIYRVEFGNFAILRLSGP